MPESNLPKYYVRFSQTADRDKILDFYDLNAHKNVLKRDVDLMKHLVDDGAVVLVEDEQGKIVASSITYSHKVSDAQGIEHTQWAELGTTRIALNGYPGLFDAMVTMQTLRAFLVEPPEDRFVAQMHTDPVQKMAGKLGWRPLDEKSVPDALRKDKEKTIGASASIGTDHWFQCGIEALPVMAKWMVQAVDNPVLENKKTGGKIQLDFSKSTFFKMFEEEIHHLAAKNFGDVNNPDPKQSVRQRRDKWLKNFFR